MKEPIFELPKKYSLPDQNLVALDADSTVRQDKAAYFETLAEEGIVWPVEIQGGGRSDFQKKEFRLSYPVGDLFLSTAVTIHELGHLRQGEIDPRFAVEELGAPHPQEMDEIKNHTVTEQDAFQRGWERVKAYAPEALTSLETKFAAHKEGGKLQDFDNFTAYYDYIVSISLKMTDFMDELEFGREENEIKQRIIAKTLAQQIKSHESTNTFFTQPQSWKCGELLDKPTTEHLIKKVINRIAEERYDK